MAYSTQTHGIFYGDNVEVICGFYMTLKGQVRGYDELTKLYTVNLRRGDNDFTTGVIGGNYLKKL